VFAKTSANGVSAGQGAARIGDKNCL